MKSITGLLLADRIKGRAYGIVLRDIDWYQNE